MQFDKACEAKDDLRQAYEKCNDISPENHTKKNREFFVKRIIYERLRDAKCSV